MYYFKHSFNYGIDLAKKSQKSTMVELESNVIQRAKLNQFDCQNLRAAQEYHSKKKSPLPVSFLWNRRPLKVQNDNQIDP